VRKKSKRPGLSLTPTEKGRDEHDEKYYQTHQEDRNALFSYPAAALLSGGAEDVLNLSLDPSIYADAEESGAVWSGCRIFQTPSSSSTPRPQNAETPFPPGDGCRSPPPGTTLSSVA